MRRTAKPKNSGYPLALELRIRGKYGETNPSGTGRTISIGSQELNFTANCPLEPGQKVELAIAWPFLLDDRVRLQLIVECTIASVAEDQVRANISRWHFRTRGEWDFSASHRRSDFETALPGVRDDAVFAYAHA